MTPDDAVIERVARAICVTDGEAPEQYWPEYADLASAAIAAVLSDPAISAGMEASASLMGGRQLAYGINTARLYSLADGDKPTPLGLRLLEIVK